MSTVYVLAVVIGGLRHQLAHLRGRKGSDGEWGSFSLEQAVIAACLLALAIGLAAVLVAAVTSHENSIK